MRLFAIFCYSVALFYGWTAVDAMRTGVAYSLGGNLTIEQRRDDPHSRYQRYLVARWLVVVGFAALGTVMLGFASRMEALESDEPK